MPTAPLIFVSAGEASGDRYGAELMESLREVLPAARFTGLGGIGMEAAGQKRVVRAEDVAVMGITEILLHVPKIYGRYRQLVRSIRKERPDAAVLIDFPDVNFRLAKHLKRMGVPVLWFVSPQLWAWKRRRLRWVQSRVAKMLTIFPFEESFYRARGVDAEFVGHPLAEAAMPAISREAYAALSGFDKQDKAREAALDIDKPWIGLLPGSRPGEIRANLPVLIETAKRIGSRYEYLIPVAPTVGEAALGVMQRQAAAAMAGCDPPLRIVFVRDARAALQHSRAAVVASGTATVQAAVIGTPFVVVYRVSRTTFRMAKRLVRYPAEIPAAMDHLGNLPIAMPNLIAGRRIVPELLQEEFQAEKVAAALRPLLEDTPERQRQMADLLEVRRSLLHPSGTRSIHRLRDAVLAALERNDTANGASA